jgi:hypothetical protein
MKDIIVIYPKENKSLVKKLVSKIESDGISCWVSPRDFKQEEKEAVSNIVQDSKVLLLILDKSATTNNEIKQALQLALENQLEIIPFVVGKIEPNLYSAYFFHVMSWVDAYEDSFEEAYELFLDAYNDLTGTKKVANKKIIKKNKSHEKVKPLVYGLSAIIILVIAFLIYKSLSTNENSELLVGQWKLSNYQDNMPRSQKDSLTMIQNLQNMRNSMKLIFNDDHTFERIGFPEGPNSGNWELNPEKTVLYLEPNTAGKKNKDIVNIEKITEKELVIFVNEVVLNGLDSVHVSTKIFFTKQEI